ncbi:NAD(P)H-binding protein [Paenibacillus hexagrammi]|uniref:NAD(P)H-binding protein n=1 Tax=Paenibacillus hexagrammi TaxID=2908839 RepID=A0ABY3SJK0_9BACL|nr:NAD(P)H-binding protein [Paenibacillus sp. YPD9-1]UJF33414.1 NAD(P)H-binding protein [Paenibacillus sp. YPD9-1]
MIVVTGANGNLGRKIVEELLARVPAEEIGVSVRDANKAQDLKECGVRVRQGNFDDSESLLHSFEQASQVLIVSSNTLEGEEAVRQHQTAIDMAKKAGVGRVLYTSHMGSSATSQFPPCSPMRLQKRF